MKDHGFELFTVGALALLVWYVLAHRSPSSTPAVAGAPAASAALPVSADSPIENFYAANPAAMLPATPESLSINIANQSAGMLSQQYIPLFGFVGMAQGSMYQ